MNKRIPSLLGALLALVLLSPAFGADEPKARKDDAEIEAKLAAARERLEAAAREVAELSGELTGPIMQDFFVMRRGDGQHAIIGVGLVEESRQDPGKGVRIESVTPGGPASSAGLKAGDVLVSIDGKDLRRTDGSSSRTLVQHVRSVKPGDKVAIEYLRDGKKQRAEVVTEAADLTRFMAARPFARGMFNVPVPPGAPGAVVAPMPPMPFTRAFRGFGGHGLLDMELITLTPKLGQYFGADKGVLVVRPPGDSDLKLEEGDVIVDIDGRAPQNGAHALRILRSYQPGEKVAINVLRNRKPVKLQFTLPKGADMGESGAAFWLESPDIEIDKRVLPAPRPAPPAEETT